MINATQGQVVKPCPREASGGRTRRGGLGGQPLTFRLLAQASWQHADRLLDSLPILRYYEG
jgi:hypothetical protein